MQFRKGDMVEIAGVIDSNYEIDGKLKVSIKPYHDIFVDRSEITLSRATFKIGDMVTRKDEGPGCVLAIAGDNLWVEFESGRGGYDTWAADEVNRVDPADETPPSAYPNGAPMFATDGTMLDDKGNRSIFDDVDAFDGPPLAAPEVEF